MKNTVIYREFSPENMMKLSYRSKASCRFKQKLSFYIDSGRLYCNRLETVSCKKW